MVLNPPAARLLVLIPPGDLPVVELAQHIGALAAPTGSAVLLVGRAADAERETETRRALAVLQSHTQTDAVPVSTRITRAPDWLAAVKQLRRPGDQVVVVGEQHAPAGALGLGRQPLAQALENQLHVPAHVVAEVVLPRERLSGWPATLLAWAANLGVIGLFFLLQAWLQATYPDGAGNTLLALSVIAEFALLGWMQQQRL
jgi:hypothetical protein